MPFYEYNGVRFRIDVEPVNAFQQSTGQWEHAGYMAVVKRDESMAKHGYVPDGTNLLRFKTEQEALAAAQKFIEKHWNNLSRRKHPVGTKVRHVPTSRVGVVIDPFESIDLSSSWVEFESGDSEQVHDSELLAL